MHSTVDTAKEIIKKGDIDDIGYLLNNFGTKKRLTTILQTTILMKYIMKQLIQEL